MLPSFLQEPRLAPLRASIYLISHLFTEQSDRRAAPAWLALAIGTETGTW